MGMSSKPTYLTLLSLTVLPLSLIKGSSILNDLKQDGDQVKQDKVLDLLNQYVLHVDRGRTDYDTKTMDLLDQYVMHVDRGANMDLETNISVNWDAIGQGGERKSSVQQNSKNVTVQDCKKSPKGEREVEGMRRNLHRLQENEKEFIKPKILLHSKNGFGVKSGIKKGRRLVERVTALDRKLFRRVKENMVGVTSLESMSGHRSRRSVAEKGKEIKKEVTVADSRQSSGDEFGKRIVDRRDEVGQDFTSGPWTHSVKLGDLVTLSWKMMDAGDNIEFLVEAATRGYVGVGFSPGGGMAEADIVLSWVDDDSGEIHVVDSHAQDTSGAPVADTEQDCTLVGGRQNESHTVVRFRRALDTCDVNDYVLGADTVRVIWATHDKDPMFDGGELVSMTWHGKEHRGVRSLHLLTPPVKKGVPRGLQARHWDVTLRNFTIPNNMDTLYWCKIFKVPPLSRKHHMIGYEPVLQPGNEIYVHHMLLHECVAPQHSVSGASMFQRYVGNPGQPCYSSIMPPEWVQCMTTTVAWAVGSQGEFLPDHIGLPLADGDRAKYFMLEIHYDNPEFREVTDSSGIRIHYTEDLRQFDGGILVNGIAITPLHIVPPYQLEYRTAGYCSSHCTQKTFPQKGIKLVSVVLHSHLAGKKLRLRHIREGRELPRVAEDGSYDFNYQQARLLPQEVSVLPGDELVTECVYQTSDRTEPTFGGFSTKQEMCLAFVLYYPRIQLAGCYSMTPVKSFFETFGVRQFYDVDMETVEKQFVKLPLPDNNQGSNGMVRPTATTPSITTSTESNFPTGPAGALDEEAISRAISALKQLKEFTVDTEDGTGNYGLFGELVISEPDEFRNRSFMSHLVSLPWSEKLLTQPIEESFYAGKHMVFCRKQDDQLAIPLSITTFPNFTELPDDDTKNKSHCEVKVRHSPPHGNAAAPSISEMSNIVFLQFATQAAIFIYRIWP